MVRDCRHMHNPDDIFVDVEKHLKIATGGTNIQSVMTIYAPKGVKTWGLRFWSSQFIRYTAYKNEDNNVMGDPANLELTTYLIENKLLTPPNPKSHFDVLPQVLKVPDRSLTCVYQLPKESGTKF